MTSLQAAFEHIDEYARLLMKEANFPGLVIGITDREKLLRISTYGLADIAAKTPTTPDTVFEIGSLGKPFTSIALLQLRDEGKLDLHDPVSEYLPWFQVQSEYPPIAVHNLMNHTGGLVRGTDLGPHGLYEAWALRHTKTSASPGQFFWYSNIGYKTLGFLLERVTGQRLPEIIQSRVLDSLGMTHSYPAITFKTRSKAATGYTYFYDDRPEHPSHGLVPAIWAEYGTGDGCEASTAGDIGIYLRMLLNRGMGPQGRVLSEESFDLMTQNGIWTGGDYYSYGLATYPLEGRNYIGHGGGNAAYRSAIVVDMEAGLGVVFLLNMMGETDPIVNAATQVLTVMRAAHRGETLPPLPPATEPSLVPNATDYVGTYCCGNRMLQLSAEDGKLLLKYEGEVVALERRPRDSFYVGHPHFQLFLLEFKRDGEKVVEAFHGADWYINDFYSGPRHFNHPAEWEAYTGHYRARNPEVSNFRVLMRKGVLTLVFPWGVVEPLSPLADGLFRIGENPLSPETLHFDVVVDGRALRVDYSGCPYFRAFTP